MSQCQSLTNNGSISECRHKCESQNADLEIGIDGSSETRRDPLIDGYRSRVCPPRVSMSGFWTGLELN